MTIKDLRVQLAEIEIDDNNRMSLLEFLVFHYGGASWDLCANQIFNPTSTCAYSNALTRALPSCFENSTRAIDSSKNQPNRLRFDRAREFSSLAPTSQLTG